MEYFDRECFEKDILTADGKLKGFAEELGFYSTAVICESPKVRVLQNYFMINNCEIRYDLYISQEGISEDVDAIHPTISKRYNTTDVLREFCEWHTKLIKCIPKIEETYKRTAYGVTFWETDIILVDSEEEMKRLTYPCSALRMMRQEDTWAILKEENKARLERFRTKS